MELFKIISAKHCRGDLSYRATNTCQRYAKTNNHIKEVCQKYGIYNPTKPRLSQWLVDTNHNLAFCGNAKVGSTTWMHHFNALLPEDERPWGNGTGTLRDSIRFRIMKHFHQ